MVALLSSSGQQRGQTRYSVYGVPLGLPAATPGINSGRDADGDTRSGSGGDFGDLNQIATWISTSTYDVRADMDLDGDVDATDQSILSSLSYGVTLGRGKLAPAPTSSAGGAGVRRGYAGYEHDGVINSVAHVRHRALLTELGRWTRRDPLGYVDGMSLYEYVSSYPIWISDPFGLRPCGPPPPGVPGTGVPCRPSEGGWGPGLGAGGEPGAGASAQGGGNNPTPGHGGPGSSGGSGVPGGGCLNHQRVPVRQTPASQGAQTSPVPVLPNTQSGPGTQISWAGMGISSPRSDVIKVEVNAFMARTLSHTTWGIWGANRPFMFGQANFSGEISVSCDPDTGKPKFLGAPGFGRGHIHMGEAPVQWHLHPYPNDNPTNTRVGASAAWDVIDEDDPKSFSRTIMIIGSGWISTHTRPSRGWGVNLGVQVLGSGGEIGFTLGGLPGGMNTTQIVGSQNSTMSIESRWRCVCP